MARPKRIPRCHPERPHQAFGLCADCYALLMERNPEWERRYREAQEVRRAKRQAQRLEARLATGWVPKPKHPPRAKRAPTCHPEREHAARGLCEACYRQQWRAGRAASYVKQLAAQRERAAEKRAARIASGWIPRPKHPPRHENPSPAALRNRAYRERNRDTINARLAARRAEKAGAGTRHGEA